MKKLFVVQAALAWGLSVSAALPEVENVVLEKSSTSSRAVITYDLVGADAVVTIDLQTNVTGDVWASLGGEAIGELTGDVGVKVSAGTGRRAVWHTRKTWKDHEVGAPGVRAVVKAWAVDTPPDYMTVDVNSGAVRFYGGTETLPGGFSNRIYRTDRLLMRRIPATGKVWRMGAGYFEHGSWNIYGGAKGGTPREKAHLVMMTNDYYMGVFECTRYQYRKLHANDEPSGQYATGDTDVNPEANLFAGYLVNEQSPFVKLRSLTGIQSFDLPTETQWEFACRAGCGAALYNGLELTANINDSAAADANLDPIAWYVANSGGHVHEVGTKEPNAFGLYDMLGNVCEACRDYYTNDKAYPTTFGEDYTADTVLVEPPPAPKSVNTCSRTDSSFVNRGGGYSAAICNCRAAVRLEVCMWSDQGSGNGFRISCSATDVVK